VIVINWRDRGKLALVALGTVTVTVVAALALIPLMAPTVSPARHVGYCVAIGIVAAMVARWVVLKYRD